MVHFAVDDHEVRFCTHLTGKSSWFLPFNQGWNDGAGNPPNPNGLKTDYLWKRILTREGLTDILENYAQIVETKDEKTGRKKAVQILPRFHQLDGVRRLLADARTNGGGHRPDPELDRLSNILKALNDQFGNVPWSDADRVHRLITEDIPQRVAADQAYQNTRQHSDEQNARIEHDKALARVMTAVLKDDTELFRQFMDDEGFRRWLTDTVFGLTYETPGTRT